MALQYLGALFAVAFVLNLVWEFAHVQLYATKVRSSFLVWQSVKDAFWITLAFILAPTMAVFVGVLLAFSFGVEFHALRTKRWEYTKEMPLFLGVGVSPLLELAVTGVGALTLLEWLVPA